MEEIITKHFFYLLIQIFRFLITVNRISVNTIAVEATCSVDGGRDQSDRGKDGRW